MGGAGGKFLILGSASKDLLRQSSESLAGRISYLELGPLHAREVELENEESLDRLWLQGGFPLSYVRNDGEESLQWRRNFIQTYLERDLPQFGFNVDSEQIDRFWRMLANDEGELYNAERYARTLSVSSHTVSRYLDMLEKLLLIRVLRPWSVNSAKRLVKSPARISATAGCCTRCLIYGAPTTFAAIRLPEKAGKALSSKIWSGHHLAGLSHISTVPVVELKPTSCLNLRQENTGQLKSNFPVHQPLTGAFTTPPTIWARSADCSFTREATVSRCAAVWRRCH